MSAKIKVMIKEYINKSVVKYKLCKYRYMYRYQYKYK